MKSVTLTGQPSQTTLNQQTVSTNSITVIPSGKPKRTFERKESFKDSVIDWANRIRDCYNEDIANQGLIYWLRHYSDLNYGELEEAKIILGEEFPRYHCPLLERYQAGSLSFGGQRKTYAS
jgi:hypothetical protein